MPDTLPLSAPHYGTPAQFGVSLDAHAPSARFLEMRGGSPSAALPCLTPERASATVVDYATSQRLAAALDAQDGYCYDNALCALFQRSDATYVEGVMVLHDGLLVEHAWLETEAGVVDPTPRYATAENGACTYFPGPRWTFAEILPLFAPDNHDHRVTPLLSPDAGPSPHRKAWIRAKLAAFRHASAVSLSRTGHPALADDEHEETLERLLGSTWVKQCEDLVGSSC